jgi:hypothetical protein
MKKALSLVALVSLIIQSALLVPASAGPRELLSGAKILGRSVRRVETAVRAETKAAGAATMRGFNKIADPKFPTGLTIAIPMSAFGLVALYHLTKGLCALEAKVTNKGAFMSEDQCRFYYGDPKANSCMASNDSVVLMFPTDETGVSAVKFVGAFDKGNQLIRISFGAGTLDEKKDFHSPDFPITAEINQSGQAVEFSLSPGKPTRRGLKEDDDQMFEFFDQVAALMRMAYSECTPGKYDAMMKKVMQLNQVSQGNQK